MSHHIIRERKKILEIHHYLIVDIIYDDRLKE